MIIDQTPEKRDEIIDGRREEAQDEYERGKQHGADDLRMSQNHCIALQRELDEAKQECSKLRMEIYRLKKTI